MSHTLDAQTMPFQHLLLADLDRRAERAERCMNRALERRQWQLVRYHREDMLATVAEVRRRLIAIDEWTVSAPEDVGCRQ